MKQMTMAFTFLGCFWATFCGAQVNIKTISDKNSIALLSDKKTEISILNWRMIGPFKSPLNIKNWGSFSLSDNLTDSLEQPAINTLLHQKQGIPTDLSELLKIKTNSAVYLTTSISALKNQKVALLLRLGGTLRIWVNNDLVFSKSGVIYNKRDPSIVTGISLQKGENKIGIEIRDAEKIDEWWFSMNVSTIDHVRDNAIIPGYYKSLNKAVLSKEDSLAISVTDSNFLFIRKAAIVEIYNSSNELLLSKRVDIKNKEKIALDKLPEGAYRYKVFADQDTLDGYFCYGPLAKIYDVKKIKEEYEKDAITDMALAPYLKRLNRLLGDYKKNPKTDELENKIAFCIFKVDEIDKAKQQKSSAYSSSSGLNLKMFRSGIDHGDEYYLMYFPEKAKLFKHPVPLVVMVPYVTNYHPFYQGGIMSNNHRYMYISKFAEKYGMAVLWPSARIYTKYNRTPIVTKTIEETLKDIQKDYNIDKNNIFLYGDCSGGLFALEAAIRRPDLFSGVGIEGPELSSLNFSNPFFENPAIKSADICALAENLFNMSTLILHSKNDHVAPIDNTFRLIDSIKAKGGKVYYDDLSDAIKIKGMKLYTEPESINKIFSFFNTKAKEKEGSSLRKIATYALYNDTIYGLFIKEKYLPGKATLTYKIIPNKQLEIKTSNVKKLTIDFNNSDLGKARDLPIIINGISINKKTISYNKQIATIDILKNGVGNRQEVNEVYGPINKVFLKTFAVVQLKNRGPKHEAIIKSLDSVWLKEYQNHILVISENQIDSAKKKGMNLIYLADDFNEINSAILKSAHLELQNSVVYLDKSPIQRQALSFVFYNKRGNNDDLYIGTKGDSISIAMISSLVLNGWHDYELWDRNYPITKRNYK